MSSFQRSDFILSLGVLLAQGHELGNRSFQRSDFILSLGVLERTMTHYSYN